MKWIIEKLKRFKLWIVGLIIGTALATTGVIYLGAPEQGYRGHRTFAEIDIEGNVLRVIVISPENLATGKWGNPENWVETFQDSSKRKNYAGPGYKYNKSKDAFIAPRPTANAVFDELTARWVVPPGILGQ